MLVTKKQETPPSDLHFFYENKFIRALRLRSWVNLKNIFRLKSANVCPNLQNKTKCAIAQALKQLIFIVERASTPNCQGFIAAVSLSLATSYNVGLRHVVT